MKRMLKGLMFVLLFIGLSGLFVGCDGDPSNNSLLIWKGELASAPADPEVNWAYYNTTNGNSYIYNGSSWDLLAKAGQNGSNGQNGTTGQNGNSIVWRGELASAPANPQTNWAYYNTTNGNSYIYNGSSWNLLARAGQNGNGSGNNSSNNVAEAEPGLIAIWEMGDNPMVSNAVGTLEIKNDGNFKITINSTISSNSVSTDSKIINVDSTAKNIILMIERFDESGESRGFIYDTISYYLSADGKELVLSYSNIISFNFGYAIWTKKD